jgi:hypothetical protein
LPKCPRCGKEIDYLINVCEETAKYVFSFDGGKGCDYYFDDSWPGDWSVFQCPECDEELFTNEEDAKKFLKGE